MKINYFKDQAEFRVWLEENHESLAELWLGFYKKASGRPSVTYGEALDEALCFGWIDGVRKSLDSVSYVQRFTPRRTKSNWSLVNIRRMQVLIRERRVRPGGFKAFAARDKQRTEEYSYEQRNKARLPRSMLKRIQANPKAWTFFRDQAPSYQRVIAWWVISAKQEQTRERRLAQLIRDSAAAQRVGLFGRPKGKDK
jgi:uncharacterized protein YdeI (YjbR/CyaY-like superfamily)